MWIAVMNKIKNSRPSDYQKLKNQWKLILKKSDPLDFLYFYIIVYTMNRQLSNVW